MAVACRIASTVSFERSCVGSLRGFVEVSLRNRLHTFPIMTRSKVQIMEFRAYYGPCPPAVSQVAGYRGGKIHRLHWHFPLRAARYEDLDSAEGTEPHAG